MFPFLLQGLRTAFIIWGAPVACSPGAGLPDSVRLGLGFRVWGFAFRVQGLGFRAWGLGSGFRVWGLGKIALGFATMGAM